LIADGTDSVEVVITLALLALLVGQRAPERRRLVLQGLESLVATLRRWLEGQSGAGLPRPPDLSPPAPGLPSPRGDDHQRFRPPATPAGSAVSERSLARSPALVAPIGTGARRRSAEEIRRDRIRAIAEERKIERLVHFTPEENLSSILKDGLISLSRLMKTGTKVRRTDRIRLDDRLDWISVSISSPNFRMFYRKRQQMLDVGDWVVLEIEPTVLWACDCLFVASNAASRQVASVHDEKLRGPKALESMFDGKRDPRLEPSDPTDVQAEVLVHETIPRCYIRRVFVNNASEDQVTRDGFHLQYMPCMFEPRVDARPLH
jgi:hypothetical protein